MSDAELDGLTYARRQIGGEPASAFARRLGLKVKSVELGEVVVTVEPDEHALNVGGTVHGGFLTGMMDFASGFAAKSALPAGFRGVHAQATYSFLRAARAGIVLECRATCAKPPKTLAHVSCEVRAEGRLVATGTAVLAVVPS